MQTRIPVCVSFCLIWFNFDFGVCQKHRHRPPTTTSCIFTFLALSFSLKIEFKISSLCFEQLDTWVFFWIEDAHMRTLHLVDLNKVSWKMTFSSCYFSSLGYGIVFFFPLDFLMFEFCWILIFDLGQLDFVNGFLGFWFLMFSILGLIGILSWRFEFSRNGVEELHEWGVPWNDVVWVEERLELEIGRICYAMLQLRVISWISILALVELRLWPITSPVFSFDFSYFRCSLWILQFGSHNTDRVETFCCVSMRR